MKIAERKFVCKSRTETFKLYVLGDVHIGALNCAEPELRKLIKIIASDPHAYWLGGGDYTDAVILGDIKRFDVNTLPDWMLKGDPGTIKQRIGDILHEQRNRWLELVKPISDKCLGMIEGNHEYSIFKYHNRDHLNDLCQAMSTPTNTVENLTDCAFIRMAFNRVNRGCAVECKQYHTQTATLFICHGHGGGRTAGVEPNKLARLAADKDVDIVLTGHTHTFCIQSPTAIMSIPNSGKLPEDAIIREKYAANWGAYVYTYKSGPSTYASRANYPVRPMYTVETIIEPHRDIKGREKINIRMNMVRL